MRELMRYKQEFTALLLVSVALLLVRWVSATAWPSTGQYDLAAQTETVVWTLLRMVIYTLCAWIGLRVVMPKGYQHMKHGIVDSFETLTNDQKTTLSTRMFAILFFGLVMLAMSGCSASAATLDARACVVDNALADVGVLEATGKNDGPEVEKYLKHVHLGKGYAWCAAFVCYHLSGCEVSNPRSAWSPKVESGGRRVWSPRKAVRPPLPGDVFSVYYSNLGRVGHVGFVTGLDGAYINTVEGNTSGPGSRDGDGVYARRRQLSKLYSITNYINDDAHIDRTGPSTGAARMQGQAQPYDYIIRAGQYCREVGAKGYGHLRAAGQYGIAYIAAAGGQERIAGNQAVRPCERNGGRNGRHYQRSMRLRQCSYQSTSLGQVDPPRKGREVIDQGREGEVPKSFVDVGHRDRSRDSAPIEIILFRQAVLPSLNDPFLTT